MKVTHLVAMVSLVSLATVWNAPVKAINPQSVQASAQGTKIAETVKTPQEKINALTAVKGKPGSGALMRRLYVKSLSPIGIQAGGAGMVVNLYSEADDTTISLCTKFDVIVAVKKGKHTEFDPSEVK